MDHRAILDVAARANHDPVGIGADHAIIPNACLCADGDITDNAAPRRNECAVVNLRGLAIDSDNALQEGRTNMLDVGVLLLIAYQCHFFYCVLLQFGLFIFIVFAVFLLSSDGKFFALFRDGFLPSIHYKNLYHSDTLYRCDTGYTDNFV